MSQTEILEELKRLAIPERLRIIEIVVQYTLSDLKRTSQPPTWDERKKQMVTAAEALLADYSADGELTVFTTLDGEDVHA